MYEKQSDGTNDSSTWESAAFSRGAVILKQKTIVKAIHTNVTHGEHEEHKNN